MKRQKHWYHFLVLYGVTLQETVVLVYEPQSKKHESKKYSGLSTLELVASLT